MLNGQEIQYGIQAGGGLASAFNYYPKKNEYTNDPDFGIPKNIPILSYNINLYISYFVNENFGVAIEPGFIQKGFANKFVDSYDLTDNKIYLSYIQVPVLMEFKFKNALNLTIGPEIGYLVDAEFKQIDEAERISLMNYYQNNRVDVGVQAGGYYSFTERLDIGLKAGASLTNLEKFYIEIDGENAFVEVRRNAMYINAFVRMRLK